MSAIEIIFFTTLAVGLAFPIVLCIPAFMIAFYGISYVLRDL